MTPTPLITRKELAARSGLSYDEIRRNEKSLGLLPHKICISAKNIKYKEVGSLKALQLRGILE